MNGRRLWNSHQRHKFLRAEAYRDILNLIKNGISRGFQEIFSTAMQFHQNTCKSGNNAVKMCRVSQHIARFECFTDPNLFKYAFNVIQNWETDVLQFYLMVLNFLLAVMIEGDKSSWLRMANQPAVLPGYRPLLTTLKLSDAKMCLLL